MYDYFVRGHDIFFRIMSHPQYCDMTAGNSADNSARLPMGSGIRPNYRICLLKNIVYLNFFRLIPFLSAIITRSLRLPWALGSIAIAKYNVRIREPGIITKNRCLQSPDDYLFVGGYREELFGHGDFHQLYRLKIDVTDLNDNSYIDKTWLLP